MVDLSSKEQVCVSNGEVDPSTYSQCIKKGAELYAIVPVKHTKPNRTQVSMKWIKPLPRWVKFKLMSLCGSHKLASGGDFFFFFWGGGGWGVVLFLRCNANWIARFTRQLGITSSIMAELWALKDELSPARQLDFNHINVEVDANMLLHKPYVGTSFNLLQEPNEELP